MLVRMDRDLCCGWIEHKSRIISNLTDASDTSDAKSSDTPPTMIMGGSLVLEEDGAQIWDYLLPLKPQMPTWVT